jgi:hypothetical protein
LVSDSFIADDLADALIFEMVVEVIVDELAAPVAFDFSQGEGLGFADFFKPFKGCVLASVPDAADFDSAAEDFHAGKRPDETASHVPAAVRDDVYLGPFDFQGVAAFGTDLDESFDR